MGTNFYWLRAKKCVESCPYESAEEERGTFDFEEHIGKRSAAGLYCWDCRATLCEGGESAIHSGYSRMLNHCPKCGKTFYPSGAPLSKGPAAVELGFAPPEEQPPTGVEGAASFSWATSPTEARQRCEANLNVVCIRDEYGRKMTGGEFLRMLKANCPIEFTHSIGVDFS